MRTPYSACSILHMGLLYALLASSTPSSNKFNDNDAERTAYIVISRFSRSTGMSLVVFVFCKAIFS